MISNNACGNVKDFISVPKEGEGWIQPSITQSYLPFSNQRIVNGIYATTADEIIVTEESDQSWFWTEEWQAGENKVEKYISDGNVQTFDTAEDFLRTLRE